MAECYLVDRLWVMVKRYMLGGGGEMLNYS